MIDFFAHLAADLDEVAQAGLYRSRRVISSAQSALVTINGRQVINFCSNDYLGMANHPSVIQAFRDAASQYGVGSGSAHLICGHHETHHALEEELAVFTGRERALLFSTGYMANIGVITALMQPHDTVLEDRLNHASLLDGGLFSGARFKRYAHNDMDSLESKIKNARGNRLIVSDGVFSMDGDLAPLDKLTQLAKSHQALLMIDDAHGFGVLGPQGGGLLDQFSMSQRDVPILMATLGKALGTFGAFVAGSSVLIETLIQKARTYVYTTALPPAVAAATRTSLSIVTAESWRREKLNALIERFQTGARQLGLDVPFSVSAIQPIVMGSSDDAIKASNALFDKGFLVTAIRPPTVPAGSARLRVTFSANHEDCQVDQLLDALAAIIKKR